MVQSILLIASFFLIAGCSAFLGWIFFYAAEIEGAKKRRQLPDASSSRKEVSRRRSDDEQLPLSS